MNTYRLSSRGLPALGGIVICLALILLVLKTVGAFIPFPTALTVSNSAVIKPKYVDRYGNSLNVTYQNVWNRHNISPVHEIPELLKTAFVVSEDKRFYQHSGPDWLARINALKLNILEGRAIRGASTITEQVVRMIHPRPRTVWSRWVEGFEAHRLESAFSKLDILEFYLNQVPYQGKRRGVKEAAAFYFNRDMDTLSKKEMLALAVFIRAPKWLDPEKYPARINDAVMNLAARMKSMDLLSQPEFERLEKSPLKVERPSLQVNAEHFIEYLESRLSNTSMMSQPSVVNTTLDAELQQSTQQLLDTRLDNLADFNVNNGTVLIIEHGRNEILAWVVGHAGKNNKIYNKIDPIITPRQPGSALKPFLYVKALDMGWTASTLIDDLPLDESVGSGIHTYHNYNRGHYGKISIREALGNSLNIPAIKAIQFVSPAVFLDFMYDLGVRSLTKHPNVYGSGIALGNGEMTLLELVKGYTTLARMGDHKPLSLLDGDYSKTAGNRIIKEDIASLIADIISDPAAREKEFGWDSILNFPHQTAVKTGTSSDYRDAWAIGYNDKYTVGVWMGNLDYSAMREITGSAGPAVVLRAVFNMINRNRQHRPLFFSSNLEKYKVCVDTGLFADNDCESRDEWFIPGQYPSILKDPNEKIRVQKPSNGLHLAMDPRIPDESEYFQFELSDNHSIEKVDWYINNKIIGSSKHRSYKWRLNKGHFSVHARVWSKELASPLWAEAVQFIVN